MPGLTLDHVFKEFPGGTVAVNDLSLDIADGEFMIFVGPSGCGKTTALRMIAGLEKITSGTICIGDHVINDDSPRDRDIAMVFQNYALYPHMTVYKNLAFGLKERKMPKDEIAIRVNGVSAMLGIDDLLKRRPAQLSGGQRQRVAMGRALVREPKAFLHGRAAVEPGREAPRAGARRPEAPAPAPGHHDHLRHARPGRGDDARRARRGAVGRRAPAARRSAGRVRPPRRTCSSPASSAARR